MSDLYATYTHMYRCVYSFCLSLRVRWEVEHALSIVTKRFSIKATSSHHERIVASYFDDAVHMKINCNRAVGIGSSSGPPSRAQSHRERVSARLRTSSSSCLARTTHKTLPFEAPYPTSTDKFETRLVGPVTGPERRLSAVALH